MMKNLPKQFLLFPFFSLLLTCTFHQDDYIDTNHTKFNDERNEIINIAHNILSDYDQNRSYSGLSISYPYNESVFPPEIAAPTFVWEDTNSASKHWLAVVNFNNEQKPVYAFLKERKWTPEKDVWEVVKSNSVNYPAEVTVLGIADKTEYDITAAGRIRFKTSMYKVDPNVA